MRTCYIQKNNYLLIVFFLFTITFAYSQTELDMLEKAYKNQSTEELKNFFDAWSQEIPPITDTELSTYNDTIQQAYKLFVDFYNYAADSIYSEWYNELYKDVAFLIVQNTLKIYFVNKLHIEGQKGDGVRKLTDSIMDFRPNIQRNGKKTLFLTKKYEKIMNTFVRNEKYENLLDIWKENFLNKYVKIYSGHDFGWYLCSFPIVYAITFEKDMKQALIFYRFGYGGHETILKKEGDKWIFVCNVSSWIE